MFNKKDSGYKEGLDTLIGANTTFEGNITSDGAVRVDGKIKGDLKVKGDVVVGNEAVVTGNIHANNIHLSGTIQGNIYSTGMLRILSTAKLYGDIQVKSFVADEGAFFQGKCTMQEAAEQDKPNYKTAAKDNSKAPSA